MNYDTYFNQQSERLIYRKLTKNDIESWVEFFENNDRLHFLGIDLSKTHRDLATEWINKQLERYELQGLGFLALIEKSTGNFIGMTGIIPRELNNEVYYEIAYSIKPKYWNQGFATEATRQVKQHGIENNIAQQFISIIDKNNYQSINVAKKNGMHVLFEMEYLGMEVFVYGDGIK